MTTKFQPMLADEVDLDSLRYPVLTSPKLDGVRASVINGKLHTRSLKLPANRQLQALELPTGLDGELIMGDGKDKAAFRETMKVVSAHDAKISDLRYFVFDFVAPMEFRHRLDLAHESIKDNDFCVPVPHVLAYDAHDLFELEEAALAHGFEGLMLRDPKGPYKFGRSTTREGYLLKMKRRAQSEAIIFGTVEQMHNANEAKRDNLGYLDRSSHQANLVPMGVLGALMVKDEKTGMDFNIGTGFTAAEREELWRIRDTLPGKRVTYEYLPHGVKDRPRHPVFLSFRPEGL